MNIYYSSGVSSLGQMFLKGSLRYQNTVSQRGWCEQPFVNQSVKNLWFTSVLKVQVWRDCLTYTRQYNRADFV